jgi:chromosome segregation ATPase
MYNWEQWEKPMATQAERIGILETKVDDLKEDVKELHNCLDRTRDQLSKQLDEMYSASCSQHTELGKKLGELEKFKDKWLFIVMGGVAVLGWATGHAEAIANFLK